MCDIPYKAMEIYNRQHRVISVNIRLKSVGLGLFGITTRNIEENGFYKLARCLWNPTGDVQVDNSDQSRVYGGN